MKLFYSKAKITNTFLHLRLPEGQVHPSFLQQPHHHLRPALPAQLNALKTFGWAPQATVLHLISFVSFYLLMKMVND